MALPRQKVREIIIAALFALDMGDGGEDLEPLLSFQFKTTRKNVQAAMREADEVFKVRFELDKQLGLLSKEFSVERIQKAELQILRLAIYEITLKGKEVPPKVAIAEAIRLTRKLATKEASQFVNAVLDPLLKQDFGT